MSTAGALCPTCRAPLEQDDRFCERCGTRVPGAPPALSAEDRTELDLAVAAAVSDRGRVHRRNEDSFRLELGPEGSVAAVVCDGTSTASAGNAAAREAALACTLVLALCRGGEITVGWVGDSRAYWVDNEAMRRLTTDDSFAEEGLAKGLLTAEQAAKSPFLHSITNWVGPNSPEHPPHTTAYHPDRPGRLMLCTDGLWNYAPTVEELGELLEAPPRAASAAEVARALVDAALERGGHDNITVVVVDIDPAG